MSDYPRAVCWWCMMRSWMGLLFRAPFRYCDACLKRIRAERSGWEKWSKG